MVRSVRPSWVEISNDVRSKPIGTGPSSSSGSMDVDFSIRDEGSVSKSISVRCRVEGDETVIWVNDPDGHKIYEDRRKKDRPKPPPKPRAPRPNKKVRANLEELYKGGSK